MDFINMLRRLISCRIIIIIIINEFENCCIQIYLGMRFWRFWRSSYIHSDIPHST